MTMQKVEMKLFSFVSNTDARLSATAASWTPSEQGKCTKARVESKKRMSETHKNCTPSCDPVAQYQQI